MTIPNLVANYQTKAWQTSSDVFERKLEEALKTMNTQQTLAGYKNTADFVAELGKHFKINKVCKNDNIISCFEDNINWEILDISKGTTSEKINIQEIKTAADLGQDDWGTEAIGVQFANGTTGIIAYNPECKEQPFTNTFSGTSCITLIYDTNGFKNPNTFTKDVRGVNSFLKSCAFKLGGTCFSTPFFSDPLTRNECEAQKNDLGIKECYFNIDYWAGAVATCGNVNNMATRADLAALVDVLYIDPSQTNLQNNRNSQLMRELGFDLRTEASSQIDIFTGEEIGAYDAYFYRFHPFGTDLYSTGGAGVKSMNSQALCVF